MTNEEYEPEHRAGDDPHGQVVGKINPVFSNSVYDKLKFVAQILLPAVGALYFGLSQIWGWPAGEEVVGSITVIDLFLGTVLGLSSRQYGYQVEGRMIGFADVHETEEGKSIVSLNFPHADPLDIVNHDKVTFKVRHRRQNGSEFAG